MNQRLVLPMMLIASFIGSVSVSVAQPNSQTPFQFAQRSDVVEEVDIRKPQIARINQLGKVCDALCQQRLRDAMQNMDSELQGLYASLSQEDRESFEQRIEEQFREQVELDVLDEQVLNDSQMDRFNQIWLQYQGINGLTSGSMAGAMELSGDQVSQIQQIQYNGNSAIDACIADPTLSPQRRNNQIQLINYGVINQVVNILNDNQVNIYIGKHGRPFDRNPDDDKHDQGDEVEGDDGIYDADGSGTHDDAEKPGQGGGIDQGANGSRQDDASRNGRGGIENGIRNGDQGGARNNSRGGTRSGRTRGTSRSNRSRGQQGGASSNPSRDGSVSGNSNGSRSSSQRPASNERG